MIDILHATFGGSHQSGVRKRNELFCSTRLRCKVKYVPSAHATEVLFSMLCLMLMTSVHIYKLLATGS